MAKPKIYIDGKEGTTGLQIYDRLAKREDIELLLIDEAKRKDTEERRKLIQAANEPGAFYLYVEDASGNAGYLPLGDGQTLFQSVPQ